MKLDKQKVIKAFEQYVAAYNAEDPKIRLKIDHTFRVAGMCRQIAGEAFAETSWPEQAERTEQAEHTDLSKRTEQAERTDLAWLTGMLHDIGRFEQVRRFGTFKDADSVDHAQLGADLLFQEGLLGFFVPDWEQNLSEEQLRILEISIRNHSAYRIQEGLTREEQIYCNILRDADKVDIFRVNWDTPMEDIYNVTTGELKQAAVTESVKDCYRNRTAVLRSLKQTAIDHLVGHLCLVFELVYPVSMRLAKEQGYVDRLLGFQSENPETQEWFRYMKETLWTSCRDSFENDCRA